MQPEPEILALQKKSTYRREGVGEGKYGLYLCGCVGGGGGRLSMLGGVNINLNGSVYHKVIFHLKAKATISRGRMRRQKSLECCVVSLTH